MKGSSRSLGRRGLLRGVGIASGIVVAAPVAAQVKRGHEVAVTANPSYTGAHRPSAPTATELSGAARAYLGIGAGARIDRWNVVDVREHLGALAVVLSTESGERFQVDVLRRGEEPGAVASTASIEVYVNNRGDGRTATDEEHGLGAMALAAHLASRESAGATAPALLTRAERRARHPLGAYRISA